MARKEVVFKLSPGGKVTVEMEGFEGKGCKALADQIQDIMKGKTLDEEFKPEYFRNTQNENVLTNKG